MKKPEEMNTRELMEWVKNGGPAKLNLEDLLRWLNKSGHIAAGICFKDVLNLVAKAAHREEVEKVKGLEKKYKRQQIFNKKVNCPFRSYYPSGGEEKYNLCKKFRVSGSNPDEKACEKCFDAFLLDDTKFNEKGELIGEN